MSSRSESTIAPEYADEGDVVGEAREKMERKEEGVWRQRIA